jgi:hypothetical protein
MNPLTPSTLTTKLSDANALTLPRPANMPVSLDAAQPGDVLLLYDIGTTPITRRLVTVDARDGRSHILVDGEVYHAGFGFHLAGMHAGNLNRILQPLDALSLLVWHASMRLEL